MPTSTIWTNLAFYWGALALALLAAAFYFRGVSRRLSRRVSELETELSSRGAAARTQEFRLERYDAVWYPAVTFSPASRQILKVACGLPHCKSCLIALSSRKGVWACPGCGASYAASLGDFTVADAIADTAVAYFKERHPGYALIANP